MKATDFSVKGVKTFRGHDGYGFNANLYYKGKKIAFVLNDNWGGGLMFTWEDNAPITEENFYAFVKTLPAVETEYGMLDMCSDIFVEDLVNVYNENKEYKRKCKSKTLIITTKCDTSKGEYIIYNRPYGVEFKAWLKKKHGDKLVEIINERFNPQPDLQPA